MIEGNLKKIKLLKFRSLGSIEEYGWAEAIIKNSEFRMSNLWNLNDAMEGIYTSNLKENQIQEIFNGKTMLKSCSFSSADALHNPLLWGYYTNGYRGIAIEVEIECRDSMDFPKLKRVRYKDKKKEVFSGDVKEYLERIVTQKTRDWIHEQEYRYLVNNKDEFLYKIKKITKVYFGNPYGILGNCQKIEDASRTYSEYKEYKKNLISFCKKLCNNRNIGLFEIFPNGTIKEIKSV